MEVGENGPLQICGPEVAQVLGLEALTELVSMGPDVSMVGVFSQIPPQMWNSLS